MTQRSIPGPSESPGKPLLWITMHLNEERNTQSLIRSIWDNVMEILKGNFPWWQFQFSHLLTWHIDALEMGGSLHFKLTHLTLVPWVSLCSESCWKLRKAWNYFFFQLWVISLSAQSWQSLWQFMPHGHQEQGSLSLWSVTRIIKAPAESFLFNLSSPPKTQVTACVWADQRWGKKSHRNKWRQTFQNICQLFAILVPESCSTLWDPMDYSLPGFSVHGISQARMLEWVAISFSRGSSRPRDQTSVLCIGRWILYYEPPGKAHYNV